MSLIAGVAPRLAALVAQHGASIAAGALSGALLGGAGVATGVIPTGAANGAPTRALTACPGSGPEVARISAGKPILVTARSADGAWLQVYVGEPGVDSGWASADALKLKEAASSLPVADCGIQPSPAPTPGPVASPPPPSQVALPTATAGPSPSPTPKASATPKPTPKKTPKPTPTPVPTSFKDPNPPVVTQLIASDKCITDGFLEYLTVTVTDADDVDSALTVTLRVDPQGVPAYQGDDITPNGDGTWEGYFGPPSGWSPGVIVWTVTATDASGNVTTVKSSTNPSAASYASYGSPCP